MWLNFPNPTAITDGKKVDAKKVKQAIYKARQDEIQSTVSEERWQGKLIKNRWDDEKVKLEEFFAWLHGRMPAYHRWSTRALPTAICLPPPQAFPRLSGDWGTREHARSAREG